MMGQGDPPAGSRGRRGRSQVGRRSCRCTPSMHRGWGWHPVTRMSARPEQEERFYLGDMCPHASQERLDVLTGGRIHELAIIEPEADPEIVHQAGEECHDSKCTPRSTELIAKPERSECASEGNRTTRTHAWCCSS